VWWGSARRSIAYVDRGTVGILKAGNGIADVSTCEEGSEFAFLETVLTDDSDTSWSVFLGPSLAEWRALRRVDNVWRRREREIAARALLLSTEDSFAAGNESSVYVADPALQSQWVAYVIANETMLAAEALAAKRKNRLRSVESLPGAVASGLEHNTGLPHIAAMICAREVAWIVKDRDGVMDCGIWKGSPDLAGTSADCRRLQLAHAIPFDRLLILRLRINSPTEPQSPGSSSEWRWTDARFNALWSAVEPERP